MPDNNEKLLLDNTKGTDTGAKLAGLLASNPRLRAMIENLSPEDAGKLGSVLSDPGQIRKIMESPQARKMAESIKRSGDTGTNGGKR